MLAEFQKAIDCTLAGLTNTFCFLDDILIVSRVEAELNNISILKEIFDKIRSRKPSNQSCKMSICKR